MVEFKKTTQVIGKYKNIVVKDNEFYDDETGEKIPVASQLAKIYGDTPFTLSVSLKTDTDIE